LSLLVADTVEPVVEHFLTTISAPLSAGPNL
jgi:hypothetical protein